MDATTLYKAGQLGPAIEALGMELRKQPSDAKRRTFLFELLCFAGQYDRAGKQLDVLAGASADAEAGCLLYRAALHAQRTREAMFAQGQLPVGSELTSASGLCNGEAFASFTDDDARIGGNLETFIAGSYTWIPFRYIQKVELQPPTRLRDLLWAPAILTTTKEFRLQDLGEVLLPVLAPLSWQHPDDAVRLGRTTVWEEKDGEVRPLGQKTFLADDREVALLELRTLSFGGADGANGTVNDGGEV